MQPRRSSRGLVDLDAVDLAHVAAVLRDASGTVPYDRVDWDTFHRRLAARAELPLARLRHPYVVTVATRRRDRALPLRRPATSAARPWWEHAARWSRLTVSSALAAGIALVGVIRLTPKDGATGTAGRDGSVVATSEDAEGSRAVFESAVIGRTRASMMDLALMPSAADLLIPRRADGVSP